MKHIIITLGLCAMCFSLGYETGLFKQDKMKPIYIETKSNACYGLKLFQVAASELN